MERVRFHFVVREFVTAFGQQLRIVGSLPELGGWDAVVAPQMTWLEGHRWKLDTVLPKQPFQFKVTMVHGDTVRWEEGANREVEAGSGEACGLCRDIGAVVPDTANYVIQIACQFDQTDTTQLALMVPKDLVQDAFEVARSALHVLVIRSQELQKQLGGCSSVPSPTHERELVAMQEAIAGHSSSVASLSDLMGSATDDDERVAVPVGRPVSLPRGASLQVLTQLAAASFQRIDQLSPPHSAGAPCRSSCGPHHTTCDSGISWSGSGGSAVRIVSPKPFRATALESYPCGAASTESREAAAELADVVQRLGEFLRRHPAPRGGDRGGHVDPSLRSEVSQLVMLMAEAEGAWVRVTTATAASTPGAGIDAAPSGTSDAAALSSVPPLEAFRRRFAIGFQDELSKAAAVHAYARDQLQRCLAAGPVPGALPEPRPHAPPQPRSLAECIALAAAQRAEPIGRPLPNLPHDDFTVSTATVTAAAVPVLSPALSADDGAAVSGLPTVLTPASSCSAATGGLDGALGGVPAGAALLTPCLSAEEGERSPPARVHAQQSLLPSLLQPGTPLAAGVRQHAVAYSGTKAARRSPTRETGQEEPAGKHGCSPPRERDAAALMAELLLLPRGAYAAGAGAGGPSTSPLLVSPYGMRRHSADASAATAAAAAASLTALSVVAGCAGGHGSDGGVPDNSSGMPTAEGSGDAGRSSCDVAELLLVSPLDTTGTSSLGGSRLGRASMPSSASYTHASTVGPSSLAETGSQVVSQDEGGDVGETLANLHQFWEQQRSPGGACSTEHARAMQRNVFQKLLGFFRPGDHATCDSVTSRRHSRSQSSSGAQGPICRT